MSVFRLGDYLYLAPKQPGQASARYHFSCMQEWLGGGSVGSGPLQHPAAPCDGEAKPLCHGRGWSLGLALAFGWPHEQGLDPAANTAWFGAAPVF